MFSDENRIKLEINNKQINPWKTPNIWKLNNIPVNHF